jgi:hypothetical protein
MAIYSMMFMSMAPFGALVAGAVAGHIGAPMTVAIGGVLAIGGAIAFGRYLPKIRMEARELIDAQGLSDEPVEEIAARVS